MSEVQYVADELNVLGKRLAYYYGLRQGLNLRTQEVKELN